MELNSSKEIVAEEITSLISVMSADLRPGRGVGDFARRVATELADRRVESVIEDRRGREPSGVLRGSDECVFLQFVPYAWHERGLIGPTARAEIMERCDGRRVAVYMHELWIGESRRDSWKNRLVGWWQRRGVLRLLHELRPKLVLTSIPVYQAMLKRHGIDAELSQLPSNLPASSAADCVAAEEWLGGRKLNDQTQIVLGGVFGAIHPEWEPVPVIREWVDFARSMGREPVLLVLGISGLAARKVLSELGEGVANLRIERAGVLSARLLSALIQRVEVGFAPTPWALIGKSGSVAAFRAAGVPVVVTRNDWTWRGGAVPARVEDTGLQLWEPGFDWSRLKGEKSRGGGEIGKIVDRLQEFMNWSGRDHLSSGVSKEALSPKKMNR